MLISQLSVEFADAIRQHVAAIFVGAGTSRGAGYPDWNGLIDGIRSDARVPEHIKNAPLAAEYAVSELGRPTFEKRLAEKLNEVDPVVVPEVVALLMSLPVSEYWTTNFDNVLELAAGSQTVARIVRDDDYSKARSAAAVKNITKMHGSLTQNSGPASWESLAAPVITRGDFERYEFEHPLIWAQLRAQFLTRSFLFLGLSFDDPNLEVLLRLSRSLSERLGRRSHFAVIRKPTDADELREFELRKADLERSGIHVAEIENFDEIRDLAEDLVRRAKEPNLFISGSNLDDAASGLCKTIGGSLATLESEISLSSLAGPAALEASWGFFLALEAKKSYAPERIRFYFRKREGEPAPTLEKRMGASYYTNLDTAEMRRKVLADCTFVLVVGGGTHTQEEVDVAISMGLPVIPIGSVEGVSRTLWEAKDREKLNVDHFCDAETWALLGSPDEVTITAVIRELVRKTL